MLKWLNSMRAIATMLMVLAVIGGFFIGRLSENNFLQIATVIIGAYFVTRHTDNKEK